MKKSNVTPLHADGHSRPADATPGLRIGDFPLDELAGGEAKPPLVSLIVINFNYAEFVGRALASIRAQDYPRFEVVVVDNASTDRSAEIIAAQIADDPRFHFIRSEQNNFVMHAALQGLAASSGQFVCFVDADDYLFRNFVSTHVQVHLALPRSVGFTSSNVVEIASDGAILAGSRKGVAVKTNPDKRGLRAANTVPRLATIADDEYDQLNDEIAILSQTKKGWLWSTGTANFYRRNVLEFALPRAGAEEISILAADGYFARFAHWLAGSALIERPLSAYRIHGDNVFGKGPSLMGLNGGGGRAAEWLPRRRRFLLQSVLERASEIADRTAPGRFWGILDQALDALRGSAEQELGDEAVQTIFADAIPSLVAQFGLRTVVVELHKLIPRRHLWRISARVHQDHARAMRARLIKTEVRHALRLLLRR